MRADKIFRTFGTMIIVIMCGLSLRLGTFAYDVSKVDLKYDEVNKTLTISNVLRSDSDNEVYYELHGTLYYEDGTLVQAISLTAEDPYDNVKNKAYVLSWKDKEYMLPASGDYTFKAWLTAYSIEDGSKTGRGPIETVEFEYNLESEETGFYNSGKKLSMDEDEECETTKDTLVTYEIASSLKKNGDKLRIKTANYEWLIDGNSIIHINKEDVSLDTQFMMHGFTKRDIKKEFGEITYVPIYIEHDGLFGFDAVLSFKIPDGNEGKYANLFYAPGGGVFSYVDSYKIDEDGMVSFLFVHSSDYLVTVTDYIYDPYVKADVVTKKQIKTIEDEKTPEAANPLMSTATGMVDGEYADVELAVIHDDFTYTKYINSHAIGVFVVAILISVFISYIIIRKEIKTHKIN